ncbi:uncharacterized protein LOC144559423 [Carex rostrata]
MDFGLTTTVTSTDLLIGFNLLGSDFPIPLARHILSNQGRIHHCCPTRLFLQVTPHRALLFPQNRPSAAPFNPNANEICQVYDKRGHTTKECWYRYNSRCSNPTPQTYQAFIALPTPTASTSEWCLDSGASHHATNDLNNISSYAPFDGFDTLHIGNGTGINILHIGSSSFSFSNFTLLLKDILHVPNLTKNILSLSKLLLDNPLLIEFSSNVCLIKDRITKTLLLRTTPSNGIYTLLLPPLSTMPLPQAYLGEHAPADLWHARLGHPSSTTTLHDEIFASVIYLINPLPSSDQTPSPFTNLFHKSPDYSFLKVLGCLCFPLLKPYNDHKLESRALPCVFIGYALSQKGSASIGDDAVQVSNFSPLSIAASSNLNSAAQHNHASSTLNSADSSNLNSAAQHNHASSNPNGAASNSPADRDLNHSPILPEQTSSGSDRAPLNLTPPSSVPLSTSLPESTQPAETSFVHPMVTRTRDHTRRVHTFPDHVAYTASSQAGHFVTSRYDPSLFIYRANGHTIVVLVYVDDIIITGSSSTLLHNAIQNLQTRFAIKDLGLLHFFLGIEVVRTTNGLHLSQAKYIRDLLVRAKMHDSKPCGSPMSTTISLSRHDEDLMNDPHLYRTIVGALQYTTITRPDIAYSVNNVSQFMHAPTSTHWLAVKRILRYLKGSPSFGLSLHVDLSLTLHAYSDSDWAGYPDDRRSTSGFCIYLGSNLVSWSSKKQPTMSKSRIKAEYRSLAQASAEMVWLQFLLVELHIATSSSPILWCDNIGATFLASNPMFHARTKHVEIDFHFIREKVAKQLLIQFICSKDQIADIFIKALGTPRFLFLRDKLTIASPPST